MINDILDFSQISNGKLSLTPQSFNIKEMLLDITKLIKFQAKRKGLEFIIDNRFPDEGRSCTLFSDPNRIKQIILNLLGNSLKFTQKGFIKISFGPHRQMEKSFTNRRREEPVLFSVEDTGLGIKKEDQKNLFELFGKLKNKDSNKVNQTGIGLGLAISQNLVKILNNNAPEGIITIDSEYGKGSTFSFLIYPLRNDLSSEVSGDQVILEEKIMNLSKDSIDERGISKNVANYFNKTIALNNPFTTGERITRLLLVDDDQINIMVITKFIDSFQNCVYDIAHNGLDALEKVREKALEGVFYQIIFMDCNMPIMDGFEASIKIMKLAEDKVIPKPFIIATTANASPLDHANCFGAGMIDFLSKPYRKAQLKAKIDLYKNR